jgi:hypothetical protein
MPTLTTAKELFAALGDVVDVPDPIDALKARGYTFSPDLARLVDTPRFHARLRSPERPRLIAERRGRRAPRLQLGRLPRAAARLPGGHHDLTIGLKLEKANQVLADAYARRFVPRAVSLGTGDTASSLDTLLTILRAELVGVPPDPEIRIGTLHITGAPTVTALPTRPHPTIPVDSTARLLVHVPVTLDFDRRPASGGGQPAVATLKAVAHFGIALGARVRDDQLTIGAGPLPFQIGALDPERLRLTIAADSPLPAKNSGSGDRIGLAIEVGGFQKVLRDLALTWSFSPAITLPVGSGFNLVARHVDVRAVQSAGAGHLMVGVEISDQPSPVPFSGQPELLERDPFDGSGSTAYVETHVELLKVLARQALASGELQQLAQAQRPNARITGADAELGDGTLGIRLEGALVDECGAFGVNFVDVNFDGWIRLALRGVESGTLRYETIEELGVGDASTGDVVACALLSILDLRILKLGVAGIEWLAGKVSDWIFGSAAPTLPTASAVFALDTPVPLTELLPRARAVAASIDAEAVRVQVALDLVPDTINTFVYLRCITTGRPEVGGGLPAKDVGVRLMDQDVPAPAGDDAPVPEVGTTVRREGRNRERTVTVTFAANPADQELARGTTDSDGRLRLVIPPGRMRSRAGVLTTTTTVQDLATAEIVSSRTTHEAISEPRPDLYFLFQVRNQPVVDSRSQPGGFALNVATKRWGTADAPLVFRVPRQGLVIGDVTRDPSG